MYNRAKHYGEKGSMTTIFFDDENKKAVAVKGICAKRNNNPGNLEYGTFTKGSGAIGKAGKDDRQADSRFGRQAIRLCRYSTRTGQA